MRGKLLGGGTGCALVLAALAVAATNVHEAQESAEPSSPETASASISPATHGPEDGPAVIVTDRDRFARGAMVARGLPLVDIDELQEEGSAPAYRRDEFGPSWSDVDGNGCRQRDDVLARDLTDITVDDDCAVLTGTLVSDPYTGSEIHFQHDRVAEPGNPGSQAVQGEHIVSLYAAYYGGAWQWTAQQRLEFANDLDNIIAVDGSANASKAEAGPGSWLVPDNPAYACTYALHYTELVDEYSLAVAEEDRAALVETLSRCATG